MIPSVDLRKTTLELELAFVGSMLCPVILSPVAFKQLDIKLMYSPTADSIDRNVTILDVNFC